jgi:hypothetical protein
MKQGHISSEHRKVFRCSLYRRPSGRRANRGVMLVFVLLFLALCSVVLVHSHSMVTRSMLQAAQSEKELQGRWARISMRRQFLAHADPLLESPTTYVGMKSASSNGLVHATSLRLEGLQANVILSGSRYSVSLEDENAKLPLNRLLSDKAFELWRSEVRGLVGNQARLRIKLESSRIQRWHDVFQPSVIGENSGSIETSNYDATRYVTIFTNDLVNYRNAPTPVLNALWKVYFQKNVPASILEMRKYQAPFHIAAYCRANGMSESEAAFANAVLTAEGRCYSLTISQRLPSGELIAHRYYVRTKEGYADDHFGDPGI